jgi:cell division protein FtsW
MQASVENNFIKRWWKVIDQQTIIAMFILLDFSLMLKTTASPAVANRIGLTDNLYFFKANSIFNSCVDNNFKFSLLGKKWIMQLAILGFLRSLVMLVLVKFYGFEVKGATRWINIGGFTYQPSEFMKPFLP